MWNSEAIPKFTSPNEPLSIEQLRKMDGELVYLIIADKYAPLEMWALIEVVESVGCVILTNNLGGMTEYYEQLDLDNDSITLYRRPTKGEI